MTPTTQTNNERGATLVELLVTLTIFAFVTLIITSSFLNILSSRNQTKVSQQLNDELRLALDSMEIEITSGSGFSNSNCSDGTCKTLKFSVATRPDITPYWVTYSYKPSTKKIVKSKQQNDGVCSSIPLDPSCTFPIISSNIDITFVNFDVVLAGSSAQRPLIIVTIKGEGVTDTGETIPLSYSTSYTPRVTQAVDDVVTSVDITPPEIIFDYIHPDSSSGPCGIYKDAAMTEPYDNSPNWTANQTLPDAYTDCNKVEISYFGRDHETGIAGGRYDGYVEVEGGLCKEQACSEYPRSAYSLPLGVTPGSSEVTFFYDDIPLRPGIGIDGHYQRIVLRAKDLEGNKSPGAAHIDIYQMSSQVPMTTEGMEGVARLHCYSEGKPDIALMVVPSAKDNPYQRNIKWYRCTPSSTSDSCDPIGDGYYGEALELNWYYSRLRWKMNAGNGSWAGYYRYTFFNYWDDNADPRPSISRDTLYTYGFVVYDKYDPSRESSLQLIEWDREFNSIISDNPDTESGIGISDYNSRFAEGRALSSNPYVGKIPSDYCTVPGDSDPDPGDPDPGDPDPGDPDPDPEYDIIPSYEGLWKASVTLGSGGSEFTNPMKISMCTTDNCAPAVSISIESVNPPIPGEKRLHPIGVGLTQEYPDKYVKLEIPSDTTPGLYTVELKLEGAYAAPEYISIPLLVVLKTSGST